jgi:hypothetical protein
MYCQRLLSCGIFFTAVTNKDVGTAMKNIPEDSSLRSYVENNRFVT